MHKEEKTRGLELVRGEVEVYKEGGRGAVGRNKTEECSL